jgi:hypothetical protein
MPHRIGQRKMQRVAFDREVERVPGDVTRGFQPGRERELPALARVRAGQQAMLDFGGERQSDRALAPFEEVVNRRLAMMTYASVCAASATSVSVCSSGG